MKRKKAAEKEPVLKNGEDNQRGTVQEYMISEHAVLLCKYFT